MKTRIFIIMVLLSAITFLSCNGTNDEEQTEQTETRDSIIKFTDEQLKVAGITIGDVQTKILSIEVPASGNIEASPGNKIIVSLPMEGYVKRIFIRHGSHVKKGDPLLEIENMEFIDLQTQFLQKKNEYEYAKTELERQEELAKENAVALKQLQQAKSTYLSLFAEYRGLEEKLKMLGFNPDNIKPENIKNSIIIRSEITGYTGEIFVNKGQHIGIDDDLLEISNPSAYTIMLNVYSKYSTLVKKGQKVMFHLAGTSNELEAVIYSVTPRLDPVTKTFKVHAEPTRRYSELIEGDYVSATIYAETQEVFALPKTAVIEDKGLKYVFLETEKNCFMSMPVKTNLEDNDYYEIVNYKDLLGKKIVLTGANYIKAKAYLAQE